MNTRILHLPMKKKWYIMTERGEKPEDYREITPYWINRLLVGGFSESGENRFQSYSHVLLRYGYTRRTMLRVISRLRIGYGNPKWGCSHRQEGFHHRTPKYLNLCLLTSK